MAHARTVALFARPHPPENKREGESRSTVTAQIPSDLPVLARRSVGQVQAQARSCDLAETSRHIDPAGGRTLAHQSCVETGRVPETASAIARTQGGKKVAVPHLPTL